MYFQIIFLSIAVTSLVAFLVASIANYNNKYNRKYSVLNTFPYELNFDAPFKENLIGNLLLILSSIMLMTFYAFLWSKFMNGFMILLMVSGIIASILPIFLVLVPVTHLKSHLIVDTLSFAFTFTNVGAVFVLAFFDFRENDNIGSFIMVFISGFFLLLYVFILLNPKLSKWGNADKVKNADGTMTYVRPKFFPLAYTEWLSILFVYLAAFLAFAQFIIL